MTIQFEDIGANTAVWGVSVKTGWLWHNGGQNGLSALASKLEMCYLCCE
jgi:hypothetical protein